MHTHGIQDQLLCERKGDVLFVTFNRPKQRNAISVAMAQELVRRLRDAETTGGRGIVLRGAQGHFCAGADVKEMIAAREEPWGQGFDPIAQTNAQFGRLCAAFAQTPLAVIAVLEGTVMGGGLGLACTADIVIAGRNLDACLPETSLGVIPVQIAPFLIDKIGFSQAKRLCLTIARLSADEAVRVGLVDIVCNNDQALEDAIAATITGVLNCAPGAIGETKRLFRQLKQQNAPTSVEEAGNIFAKAARSPEGVEGLAAFLQKRRPSWARGVKNE